VSLQQVACCAVVFPAPRRCCCLFYKAAKEVQQADIQQMAWWVPRCRYAHAYYDTWQQNMLCSII
jgi:hypothetical protein